MKIVISPHGMMDQNFIKSKKNKEKNCFIFISKIIFKNSDLIIVNSKIEKKNFLEN
jgi:hypothetical protein